MHLLVSMTVGKFGRALVGKHRICDQSSHQVDRLPPGVTAIRRYCHLSVAKDDNQVRRIMEQRALKYIYNCLNNNIYSYLQTSGGQSSNLYLNVVQFFNASVN
jgi:hypothetical protein